MLSDLHDLFDDAIGDVPAFSYSSLATRLRRRRRRQLGAVAGTAAAAVAVTVAVARPDRGGGVALKTRPGATDTAADVTTLPFAASTAAASTTTATIGGTVGPTVAPTTTAVPAPAPPQVGDFDGSLTASSTTVAVGDTTDLRLTLVNVTDHPIDLSPPFGDPGYLILTCTMPNVAPGRSGVYNGDGWNFDGTIAPGQTRKLTATLVATDERVGANVCTAAIVDSAHQIVRFYPAWYAVTAIPSLTITVDASSDTTTTTTLAGATTTEPPTSSPPAS